MAEEQPDKAQLRDTAERKILELIAEGGPGPVLRDLAEAWAWLRNPNPPHGGSTKVSG